MLRIQSIDARVSSGFFFDQHPMLYALSKSWAKELQLEADDEELIFYTINLLGYCLNQGHSGLDLKQYANKNVPVEWQMTYIFPELEQWQLKVQTAINSAGLPLLVFYRSFLFLSRMNALENGVANALYLRASKKMTLNDISVTNPDLWQKLTHSKPIDWQQLAIINSLSENLALVIGGPGTGKTTTVASLLTAVYQQEGHSKYRIALAAPTGKAATRMAQALFKKLSSSSNNNDIVHVLPKEAQTLHRLLEWSISQRRFIRDKNNPLVIDCLIVDEVSMIDLTLFAALLDALPLTCRLILLGDAYQLPSVGAGSILAELCQQGAVDGFSAKKSQQLAAFVPIDKDNQTNTPLADNIISLKKSYRFSDDKGIGLLANACLKRNIKLLHQALKEPEVTFFRKPEDVTEIIQLLKDQHRQIVGAITIIDAFAQLNKFQLLCATKEGDFSTMYFNQTMAEWIARRGETLLTVGTHTKIYHGLPILIEANRHDLELYNGDTGLIWQEGDQLWLCFLDKNNVITRYLPQQIQGWSPAYAITVHKSQGSEYDNVAFVTPSKESPLLNRELLYTAITRAKEHLYLLSTTEELDYALSTESERHSALAQRMNDFFD